MGTLFVDKLDPQSGTSLEIGSSGDTVSVNTGATTNLLGNVTLGASGKTITVPSGCTITNNGTQTGFGGANTPAFHAYLSSNQSVPSQTATKINIDTEVFDTDNKFASNKFTPTVAGKYFLYGSIQTTSSEDFDDYQVKIYKNGSNYAQTRIRHHYADAIKVVTTAIADTDDYFELYCYVGSTTAKTIFADSAGSYFGGYKIIE